MNADGLIVIKHNKFAYQKVKFMKNLLQSFVDTYYIGLTTLISLQLKGNNFDIKHITTDLQQAITEMYYQGAIAYLNSSLRETIDTSFKRFAQMGLCEFKTYESSAGPNTTYLRFKEGQEQKIFKYHSFLELISSCSNSNEKLKIVEMEVEQAVNMSLGNIFPKL